MKKDVFHLQKKQIEAEKEVVCCHFSCHGGCKGDIIDAHSIQNNTIIRSLCDKNGEVYMPTVAERIRKADEYMSVWRKGKATTFKGFCKYHDNLIFQEIENGNTFNKSKRQSLIHTYRIYILCLHRTMEDIKFYNLIKSYNSRKIIIEKAEKLLKNSLLRYDQLIMLKNIYDNGIIDGDLNAFDFFIWTQERSINFAASGYFNPVEVVSPYSSCSMQLPVYVFYTVFSEMGKTYAIYMWKKDNISISLNMMKEMMEFDNKKHKIFINNLVSKTTENIVIRPSSWQKLTDTQKKSYGRVIDLIKSLQPVGDMNLLEDLPFDLFEI